MKKNRNNRQSSRSNRRGSGDHTPNQGNRPRPHVAPSLTDEGDVLAFHVNTVGNGNHTGMVEENDDQEEEEMISLGLQQYRSSSLGCNLGIPDASSMDSNSKTNAKAASVGANRKSSYPATPSTSNTGQATRAPHRRTPGPPSQSCRQEMAQHRRTPGAGMTASSAHDEHNVNSRLGNNSNDGLPSPSTNRFKTPHKPHTLSLQTPLQTPSVSSSVNSSSKQLSLATPHNNNPHHSSSINEEGSKLNELQKPPQHEHQLTDGQQKYESQQNQINANNQNQSQQQSEKQPRQQGEAQRERTLYTPAHFTLSKNPHLHMDGNRPEAFSPNTIRMTDSLDKLLRDDDDDDDDEEDVDGVNIPEGMQDSVDFHSSSGSMGRLGGNDATPKESGPIKQNTHQSVQNRMPNLPNLSSGGPSQNTLSKLSNNNIPGTPTVSNVNRKRANSSDWNTENWFDPFRYQKGNDDSAPSAANANRSHGIISSTSGKAVRMAPTTQIDPASIAARGAFRRIQSEGSVDTSDDDDMEEIDEISAGGDVDFNGGKGRGISTGSEIEEKVSGLQSARKKEKEGQSDTKRRGKRPEPLNFDRPAGPSTGHGVSADGAFESQHNNGNSIGKSLVTKGSTGAARVGTVTAGRCGGGAPPTASLHTPKPKRTVPPQPQLGHPTQNLVHHGQSNPGQGTHYSSLNKGLQTHESYFAPLGGAEGIVDHRFPPHYNAPHVFGHHSAPNSHHHHQFHQHHYAPSPPTYPPMMHEHNANAHHQGFHPQRHYTPAMPSSHATTLDSTGYATMPHVISPVTIPPDYHAHVSGRGYSSWSPVPHEFDEGTIKSVAGGDWNSHSSSHVGAWNSSEYLAQSLGDGAAGAVYNSSFFGEYGVDPSNTSKSTPFIAPSTEMAFHPITGHISPDLFPQNSSSSMSPPPFPSHHHIPHHANFHSYQFHQSHGNHIIQYPPSTGRPMYEISGQHLKSHISSTLSRYNDGSLSSPGEQTRPRKDSCASGSSSGSVAANSLSPTPHSSPPQFSTDQRGKTSIVSKQLSKKTSKQTHTLLSNQDNLVLKKGGSGDMYSKLPPHLNSNPQESFGNASQHNKGRGKKHGDTGCVSLIGAPGLSQIVDRRQGKKTSGKQQKDRKQQTQQFDSQPAAGQISNNIVQGGCPKESIDEDLKRPEFAESPAVRQAFKDFGRQFRQKENESLDVARDYALDCLNESNTAIYLPPSIHWRVFLELADIAKRSNHIGEARKHYMQACKLQPHASQGWLEHSKLEEECGNLHKCADILQKGLEHCTTNESLLIRAVKFYERMGCLTQARYLLARLKHLSIDKSWKTMLEGALLEARAGKYGMAREVMKYLMHYVPWYGPLYLAHTKLERDFGSVADAFSIVQRGLKELPRYGPLYFQAFHLCEKEDLCAKAYDLPRTMEIVSRANNISRELLWKVQLEAAQIQERASVLAVQEDPSLNLDSELIMTRRSYATAIMLCPTNLCWKIWLASGRSEVLCGNTNKARALFLRAYDTVSEKGRSTVLLECARLEEFCGDLTLARSILCKARHESGSSDWKVWLSSVNLEWRCGLRDRAIAFAKMALNIHKGTGRLWAALIQLCHEDGELHQVKILQRALQAVPKSGEVWCEGARIFLNPFSPTFDIQVALRHLCFAARFTPQYGDSFLERLRLDMISLWIVPVATPFIINMYDSFLSSDKMHLTDAYNLVIQHAKDAADAVKIQHSDSTLMIKEDLDTSELELRCSSADPNYGHLWFRCRESPIDTAREVILRAKLLIGKDIIKHSFVYVAAMVRRAGILMTIQHQAEKIILSPDIPHLEIQSPSRGLPRSESLEWDIIVNARLRSAPSLDDILLGSSKKQQQQDSSIIGFTTSLAGSMFVTGYVDSNRRFSGLSDSERQTVLFGSDSLLS